MVFDLQFPDEPTAFGARKKLETLFHSDFIPVLETVLDQHAPAGRPYYIPRLEIDLGSINPEQVETLDLAAILHRQLVQQLSDISFQDVQPLATPLSEADTLYHFLRNGTWPSLTVFGGVNELEQAVRSLPQIESTEVMTGLSSILTHEKPSLRLVYQCSQEFVDWVMGQLIQSLEIVLKGAHLVLSRMKVIALKGKAYLMQSLACGLSQGVTPEFEKQFKKTFAVFFEEVGQSKFPLVDNQSVGFQTMKDDTSKQTISDRDGSSGFEEEAKVELYTSYAGVVLLHPFLGRLFQDLDFLNAHNQFKSEGAQRHAIHILHFLASGVENPEEPQTCLLKILCGYPLAAPLERVKTLENREKEETLTLLLAVIGHWATLKNTSPDSFRQEFLQREGKLETRDSGFHLTVEQRSIDVLLSSLPWSYSIIRLPWMDGPLRVDWA